MKLETFFEKFDQFADAPDAVAKMRELVLQLAVRGQLVAQNPKDEPASKAIERLVAQNGTGRTAKLFAEEESVELPFAVPASWKWVRFGDLVRIRTGKLDANAAVEGGEYPFFTCSKTPSQIATYSFDTSAVILAGNGDFNLKSYSGKFDAYQRTYVIEPLGWELGFCFWLISAQIKRITDNQRGSAIPYLRLGDIADPLVPFPPLAEQKRIVAKVDELMALCDRLEAQQQERETRHAALARASLARFADAPTPANLTFLFHPSYAIPPADLRKSILTLAVQGKLVPQDPNDTPASEMLASDAKLPDGHVRRRKIMKRAPIASKAEMFPDLPPSWEYVAVQTLYDLNMIVDYADGNHGSLYPRSSEFGDSGVTFVTARDIANGRVSWEGCARLNEDRAHQLTKGWARGGDVLLTHNATVGRVAKVEREIGKFLLGTSATFYRLNEEFIDPSYFYHVLCSPTWQSQLEAIMEQTTRNQVSIQKQAYFQVPIPPLAEQRRIVAKVEQLMALVDALETQLAASRATGENLLSALVAELTGTPNDGKVSVPSTTTTGRRGRPRKSP